MPLTFYDLAFLLLVVLIGATLALFSANDFYNFITNDRYANTYHPASGPREIIMNQVFQQTYVIPGTLAANHNFYATMPFDAQLVHVSLVNTTANAGTLKIGKSSDDDAYLLAENFGVSATPVEVATPAGFDGADAAGQYPHIPDGTILFLTVTDHGSHMANVCVVLHLHRRLIRRGATLAPVRAHCVRPYHHGRTREPRPAYALRGRNEMIKESEFQVDRNTTASPPTQIQPKQKRSSSSASAMSQSI